jgi:hypothetical protein
MGGNGDGAAALWNFRTVAAALSPWLVPGVFFLLDVATVSVSSRSHS